MLLTILVVLQGGTFRVTSRVTLANQVTSVPVVNRLIETYAPPVPTHSMPKKSVQLVQRDTNAHMETVQ